MLILTARGSWAERIDGLKAGADDYLTKPFHPEELALRIQALLRRAHGLANQSQLEAAGLRLDEQRQCVCLNGADVDLTAAEFRLLRYFMLHPGQVPVSYTHLSSARRVDGSPITCMTGSPRATSWICFRRLAISSCVTATSRWC